MRYRLGLVLVTMALLIPLPCTADEPIGSGTAQGSSTSGEQSASLLRPSKPVPVTLTDVALADVRAILSEDNSCSGFFGGAKNVLAVLDAVVERIKLKELPDRRLGIRMTGDEGFFVSSRSGYQYRLFKQIIINTNGPFYNSSNSIARVPQCGSFAPNTREARVLMLLHELGHLIKGADGQWLLADDGHNYQRSLTNTKLVESRCLAQIKALQLDEVLSQSSSSETTAAGHKP
jgi:hypothetical protein